MASLLLPDDQDMSPAESGLLGPGLAPAGDNFDDIVRRAITGGFARNLRPSEETEDRRVNDPTWTKQMHIRAALQRIVGKNPPWRKMPEQFSVPDYELPPEYEQPSDTYVRHIVTNPTLP